MKCLKCEHHTDQHFGFGCTKCTCLETREAAYLATIEDDNRRLRAALQNCYELLGDDFPPLANTLLKEDR